MDEEDIEFFEQDLIKVDKIDKRKHILPLNTYRCDGDCGCYSEDVQGLSVTGCDGALGASLRRHADEFGQ